jgi:glycosyltransferase involved in cell wall biosynthesis
VNILLLPSWYPTRRNPLSGIFFREQALALHHAGINVYVLALNIYSIREFGEYIRTNPKRHLFNDGGVQTYIINYLNVFPRLRILLWLYSSRILKKYYKKMQRNFNMKFDIVHIHSALQAGFIYYFSGIKTKFVLTEHSSAYSRGWLNNLEKKYLPQIFNNATCLIAVGNGLKIEMKKYTNKPIKVIYNIVYLDKYIIKIDYQKSVFRFAALGLNLKTKGFDILIKAYKRAAVHETSELYIAGLEGEEMRELQELADKSSLKNVRLFGKLSREETASYMYNCDCFVLPSRFETFGVVFAEAMFYGKPVIATKTGGPDSFITPENGIIVSINNIEETAIAMEIIYRNIKNYNVDYIKEYAQKNFSSVNVAKKLIEIYEKV